MLASRFLSFALLCSALQAATPVLDDLVPLDGTGFPARVEPRVPVGKALLFPVTASDGDGDVLSYKVRSSNPAVLVRARTGHPKLKLQVSHAAGAANDPAFTGTLEVALFRDLTPQTADIIGGFAQAGYYDGQIFHRIANLDPTEQPDGSFIVQGGDPAGTGTGGPGFNFENEFKATNLFTGRGQFAMANAGTNAATFRGTNGSQFFFTDGQPRFLDFNHTIMGQLLRGWDTLKAMTKVARGTNDKPTVDVRLQSAGVEFNPTDAILLITATAPGTATITVEVTDGTSAPVVKTMTVTAYKDTRNSPPFLTPIANRTVPKETIFSIPLKVVDLENDFVFYSNQILSPFQGQSSGSGNPARAVGNPGYVGPLNLGIGATQYDMTYRGAIDGAARAVDDQIPVAIAVGDKNIRAKAEPLAPVAGVAMLNVRVAGYTDSDPRGQATDFAAQINWGDGTPLTTGTIARDPAKATPTAFAITGTHTYAKPGTYPLTVQLTASKGQRVTVRSLAVVRGTAPAPIVAFGRTFKVNGATLTNGVVATFKHLGAVNPPASYTARIQWGDGTVGNGTVRRIGPDEFQVLASHVFPDPEDYSVVVSLSSSGPNPTTPGIAWSRAEVRGFTGQPHLPPFATPNLIGQMTTSTVPGTATTRPLRETAGSQTYGNIELIVINAGTKASPAAKIQFYLSEDKTLNRTAQGTNPADLRVNIADLTEVNLDPLQPGGGIRYVFANDGSTDSRLRFPTGENGAGLNLLAHLEYRDPIADHLPIARQVVFGPYDPFIVRPTGALVVKEAGGEQASAKFRVKLGRQPRANVTIPLTLSTTDAAQIEISATSLVFTSTNWNTFQEVTVTAKDDNTADGTKAARVVLGAADSTDVRFDNLDPADVSVTVLDKTTN